MARLFSRVLALLACIVGNGHAAPRQQFTVLRRPARFRSKASGIARKRVPRRSDLGARCARMEWRQGAPDLSPASRFSCSCPPRILLTGLDEGDVWARRTRSLSTAVDSLAFSGWCKVAAPASLCRERSAPLGRRWPLPVLALMAGFHRNTVNEHVVRRVLHDENANWFGAKRGHPDFSPLDSRAVVLKCWLRRYSDDGSVGGNVGSCPDCLDQTGILYGSQTEDKAIHR